MNKGAVFNPFHIKVDTYTKFQNLESALYRTLKDTIYDVDLEELNLYVLEFSEVEQEMRAFHDRFRHKSLEEFVEEINGKLDCVVLDCTHRVELLSYVCAIQLLLQAVMKNTYQRHVFVGVLLSVMNQYNFRGDPVPAYFQWNLQSSSYH